MIADHERWALSAAAMLALMVEPERLNGLILRDRPGPVREAFLELLHQVSDRPIRRLNSSPDPGALLASMDLGASLRAGRRIQGEGVLERAARSILIIPMAERLDGSVAAALAMALDRPDAPTMILLDEGADDEHTVPQVLADRMSISLNHDGLPRRAVSGKVIGPDQVMAARAQMARGVEDGAAAMTLTRLAGALGIGSLRAPILALRLARALAALDTAGSIGDRHIEVAALLCLAPRASVVPVPDDEPDAPPAEEDPKDPLQKNSTEQGPLEDRVLEAIAAAVPDLMLTAPRKRGGASATGAGDRKHSAQHGRPVRPRRGRPEGARLDIFATVLAAAPWQALRRREYPGRSGVVVLPDDFRIKQFEHPAESVLIFL
ncbi:MAG: magnesium chelatase ATPase subunit D, partial [Pseudomonadota bacterium]